MAIIVDYLQKSHWSFVSRKDLSRQELEDIFVLIQYFDIKVNIVLKLGQFRKHNYMFLFKKKTNLCH